MPPDFPKPAVIHNDFKFDNVVLDPDNPLKIIGVLDWEMATVGDPLMDLGSSLGYWVQSDDPPSFRPLCSHEPPGATEMTSSNGMLKGRASRQQI
jgi:aminoglycoside phosphotransferase (APT) family kinase protein